MKILLVAINAKYIHSNLAIYSLRAFAEKYADHIKILELTINHSEEDILKLIFRERADVVAFSCYIWNIDIVKRATANLKRVQEQVKIWYGGPEVSYDYGSCLQENEGLDGIMIGEGEQTFLELAGYYIEDGRDLDRIKGIACKACAQRNNTADTGITVTSAREPLPLDCIPFPYRNMELFQNRIIYYESSRGCPFSCSYCLSSIDRGVRLRSTELVKSELELFIDYHIPQVKFVDRTFNCNRRHAMEIWQFIKDNDNGITNFHFEISADLLTEEELQLLAQLRPGQVQFEIGVQSTNPATIKAIRRRMDFSRLRENVLRIKKAGNIHQHLDLIAGLPSEDFSSFERSFQEVYELKPDQLQLGFLKVLKGSAMEKESREGLIACRSTPPYEVLFTDKLSYEELLKIKGICEMVEIYYNSLQFTCSIGFLEHSFKSPMGLYLALSSYYESKGYAMTAHNRQKRYEILLDFYKDAVLEIEQDSRHKEKVRLFKELLAFDMLLREGFRSRPSFSPARPIQDKLRRHYAGLRKDRRLMYMERFSYDVMEASRTGNIVKRETVMLFDYSVRDPLSCAAKVTVIDQEESLYSVTEDE